MKQYLLGMYQPEGRIPPPEVLDRVMRDLGVINQDMVVGCIAAGGDPKTVTVGEVVSRRRSATRSRAIFPRRLSAVVS